MSQTLSSQAAFGEAIELINAGQADKAEAVCRAAVERNPEDVNLLGMLGAVLVKMNRLVEAVPVLRKTIALAPSFAKPHEDLGFTLLAQRQPEQAVEILRTAVRLDPQLDAAFLNLGKALAMIGKGKEADEAFEASFALDPQRKTLALAAEHQKAGRVEEAEKVYRQVLRSNPENVDAMRLLAMVAMSATKPEDAERLLRRAVQLAPDFVGAIVDLGRVLQEQSRFEDAIECFQRALTLEPDNAHSYFLLGGALAPAARTFEAVDAYRRAIEINPKHAAATLGLGHVLKTVGRQGDSIQAYRKCIELKPDNGESYWSLANLKTYKFNDADIQAMTAQVDNGALYDQSEVNFLFSLAKAYEDRNDYDNAWHYYQAGNAKQRMLEQYDPVRNEVNADDAVAVFSGEFLQETGRGGNLDGSPIFIVGLPRSGSTLIEQVIASHSQVEGTSELPYIGKVSTSLNINRADGINYPHAVRELRARHLQTLGSDYLDAARLHRVEGKPRFIDKMPNNFPNIGFIHLILPNAKIIDARRHPLDACLGCYRQLFAKGQTFTYDLTDIGEYYLQYQRLMDHWHEVLPGRVLTVQYEDVVSDFDNQVGRILEYCDLPWEDACVRFHETDRPVRTASSEQVRLPIYTTAVNFSKNYEKHLGELTEVLEPVLNRYKKNATN
jgi:tetratricopeptide (TPR) repeat protein